jgi:uncharacterized membrane protein
MQSFPPPRARPWKPARSAVLVSSLLLVSACAAQGGGEPLTPAQQQLQQANQRFATTVGEGALVGAVLGAGLGYLTGGARGAAIGAAAGGVAGVATGWAVAHNNLAQAHTEANLNQAIREANNDADAYDRSAAASMQIAAEFHNQLALLNQRYASHSISAAQYQATIASYRNSADTMRKQLTEMAKESAGLRADAGSYRSPDLARDANRIDQARQREAAALGDLDRALSAVPTTG